MSQSASHGHPPELGGARPLPVDGEISTGEFTADDGLTEKTPMMTVRRALVSPLARLNPHELADVVANRVLIERAVGVLMLVYDLDADNACELLRWGAQALGITLGLLARRLTEDLSRRPRDREGLARCERVDLRSACDDVLFTAHEHLAPVSPARAETLTDRPPE